MKSGLFKQYFTIFFITLLSCTALLGIMMLTFSGLSYSMQREELLASAAQSVNEAVQQMPQESRENVQHMQRLLESIHTLTGNAVFVADEAGVIFACSEQECHHGTTAPKRAVSAIDKGLNYFGAGRFVGFVRGRGDFTYGTALLCDGQRVGYVFASTPIGSMFSYLGDTLFTYLFSAGVMLLVAFVVIYTATLRLTMPLQQ
ncbi:MAG: hypothetical protein IKV55_05680, partial [Oscillospiraceae bacterium]|nr:hypothetical protein [Oscillospiraceae bacterium]